MPPCPSGGEAVTLGRPFLPVDVFALPLPGCKADFGVDRGSGNPCTAVDSLFNADFCLPIIDGSFNTTTRRGNHLAIAEWWSIPLHRECACRCELVPPGESALPFVDFLEILRGMDASEQNQRTNVRPETARRKDGATAGLQGLSLCNGGMGPPTLP
jgi:hypothetical protein